MTDWDTPIATNESSLCLKTDGTLWTWGKNGDGELGLGDTADRNSPVQVGALTTWTQAGSTAQGSGAIKTDGTLWVWGYNNYGQLGVGNTTNYSSPRTGWRSYRLVKCTRRCLFNVCR